MADLISLEEALARIFEQVRPLDAEPVPLAAAAGRVIAEDARSPVDLPPFASSAMDGYAVRSSDTPGRLPVVALGEVSATQRPHVVVLATGTELRRPGEPLGPGEVYEANGVLLATAFASAGADVEILATVADDASAHRRALESGLAADVLVTSGGVSVGPHDLVRGLLAELGVEEIFWGVAVKPGKPLAFGVRGSTLVFGLPGNPVSSLVGAEVFVRPALLALQGASVPGPVYSAGSLASAIRRNAQRDEFVRARSVPAPTGVVLEPITGQESHMIARAATADALVHAPRGDGELAAGETVRYLPLA